MKPTTRELRLPRLRMSAGFEPSTLNAEARTIELLVYSGATVDRFPAFSDPYRLTFALDAKSIRMGRLQAGAPLKAGHASDNDLGAVVGVVESAHLAADGLRARVRFSRRADVEPLFQDVRDGVIRNVSMEAIVHRLEDVTKKADAEKHLLAVDWEPAAVALIGVPADPGAHALAQGELHTCILTSAAGAASEKIMDTTTTTDADLDADEQPPTRAALLAENAELKRREQIRRAATHFGVGETFAQKCVNEGSSIEETMRLAAEERRKRDPIRRNDIGFGNDYDSPGARVEQMAAALVDRMTGKPSPQAGRYGGASIVECAFETLKWSGHHRGLDVRHNGARIVELSHSTSDFPLLLGNVLNKRLLPAYESAQPTFRQIAAQRDFTDFRAERFLRGGDFPIPLEVREGGEVKLGTMSESQELVSMLTYGRRFAITRNALINDDLSFFDRLAGEAAQRVADLHNSIFFLTCITAGSGLGPNLSDGVAVYNSAHGNLTSAGVISVILIGEGRAKMMTQTSLDGLKMNLAPRYLLTSPASLTLAEQLVATLSPTVSSEVNPFAGRLIALGDANLSGTRFYLLADPARLPQYIYGGLRGEAPLRFDVRPGWEVLGAEARVVSDFGCGAVESRAGVSGSGA